MEIYHVNDPRFAAYGKVFAVPDCRDLMHVMEQISVPEQVVYEASCPELEECESIKHIRAGLFGGMEVQAGYCSGHNSLLDAVEYHKCSEVNLAVTDLVLLLGREQDICRDGTYPTKLLEAFFIPKGTLVEVYGTTLHYAPCQTSEQGFSWMVILPRGTNTELEPWEREMPDGPDECKLLFARNKWLIAHEEAGMEGAFVGLTGENLQITVPAPGKQ